eukprot:SM000075S21935  [mRNA]  locus=s75:152901:155125:- [translate_table: standard]
MSDRGGSAGGGEAAAESGGPGRPLSKGRGRRPDEPRQGRAAAGGGEPSAAAAAASPKAIDALGRTMTAILRHKALDYGLSIRPDGYVPVADILSLQINTGAKRQLNSHSVEDVRKVNRQTFARHVAAQAVELDNKQRFALLEEGGQLLIRANQGHTIRSVTSEHLLQEVTDPDQIPDIPLFLQHFVCMGHFFDNPCAPAAVCVHGTFSRYLESIMKTGLNRMARNHIHFAKGLPKEAGVISGMRGSCEVLIYINVKTAMKDGIRFYVSDNNVILSDGVEGVLLPKYFKEVVSWPDHRPML